MLDASLVNAVMTVQIIHGATVREFRVVVRNRAHLDTCINILSQCPSV